MSRTCIKIVWPDTYVIDKVSSKKSVGICEKSTVFSVANDQMKAVERFYCKRNTGADRRF